MPITFLNAALLAGLAAIALPPLIHLLTRRKFDTVAWGAMQFLDLGNRTRRRAILDELLLMALRMGLIAMAVLALAAPAETAGWFAGAQRSERDLVFVIDGSGSMGLDGASRTALEWVRERLGELGTNDSMAVVRAGAQSRLVAPSTTDRDVIGSTLQSLPPPRGGCDGPGAIAIGCELLGRSTKADRRVVIVSDGQRHGWADEISRLRLDVLSSQQPIDKFRIDYVNIAPQRAPDSPRWSLDVMRTSRAVAAVGQSVTIRSALRFHGQGTAKLPSVRLEVDGQPAGPVTVSGQGDEPATRPIVVQRAFATPGSHLVSLRFQSEERGVGDRVDLAVDVVPTIPVLLVDGDERSNPPRLGAEFLRDALAPPRDPQPSFLARVVPIGEFRVEMLTRDIRGPNTSPRVLVLADVPRLAPEQIAGIEQFVVTGGGLLVTHGTRTDVENANRTWLRGGAGWLPANVGGFAGTSDLATAAQPLTTRFAHPALEIFRMPIPGGLSDARFPRYRPLSPGNGAVVIAALSGDSPFLVEKQIQRGRVIQSAAPLDDSDQTNLVELPAFAPFAHELVAYLAGGREPTANLSAGQAYRWTIPESLPVDGWKLRGPDGNSETVRTNESRTIVVEAREPGAYALTHSGSPMTRYFVIADDPAEADLTPLDDADKSMMQKSLPSLRFDAAEGDVLAASPQAVISTDLSWIAFCGVVALLSIELWLTRKRAANVGA